MRNICWAAIVPCVFLAGVSAALRGATSERHMFHKPIVDLRTHSGVFDQVSGAVSNKSCILVGWKNGPVFLHADPQLNTVSNILKSQRFHLENLNRFQLRIFKRNQILQTHYGILEFEENPAAQAVAGTELVPGDVIIVIPTGM